MVNSAHYFISHLRHVWIIQSELQIPKWKKEETFRLPFTQQGVAGRGGDEKKKIDGEKIHTRGEKMPQGASTDFYP